jgi:hypothetical protein
VPAEVPAWVVRRVQGGGDMCVRCGHAVDAQRRPAAALSRV